MLRRTRLTTILYRYFDWTSSQSFLSSIYAYAAQCLACPWYRYLGIPDTCETHSTQTAIVVRVERAFCFHTRRILQNQ